MKTEIEECDIKFPLPPVCNLYSEEKPVIFHEYKKLQDIKIEVEEYDTKPIVLPQISDLYYSEQKPVVCTELNLKHSRLAVDDNQDMNLNFHQVLDKIKVEQFEENLDDIDQPLEDFTAVQFGEHSDEEKNIYNRYVLIYLTMKYFFQY